MNLRHPVASHGPCGALLRPMDSAILTDLIARTRVERVRYTCTVGHSHHGDVPLAWVEESRPALAQRQPRTHDAWTWTPGDLKEPVEATCACGRAYLKRRANQLGCGRTCVKRAARARSGRRVARVWPDEEVAQFVAMWNAGTSSRVIEAALGLRQDAAPGYAVLFRKRGHVLTARSWRGTAA